MRKKYCVFLLSLALLLFTVSLGWAFGEIRYSDRPLNLRKGRSARAAWVGSLYPGQKVRVAYFKDGWVAIFEPGATNSRESACVGYSNAKYLKKERTRHEPKGWGELVYTPRTLNVRSKPNINGRKLDTLTEDEHVRIDFPEDDWTMVFWPSATIRSKLNARGYSSAKYFKPATDASFKRWRKVYAKAPELASEPVRKAAPAAPKPAPVSAENAQGQVSGTVASPPPAPAQEIAKPGQRWGQVVTVPQRVNLRQKRTSSSKHIRTLKPGEKVRVDFLKNGWYAVFKENELMRSEKRALGYVLQSLIEAAPVSDSTPAPQSSPKEAVPVMTMRKDAKTIKQTPRPEPKSDFGEKKTMVIDRSKFAGAKRPDPTPDKTAHGYQYRIVEKSETKRLGESWITVKVFLATKKLPGSNALKDFSTSIWKEYRRQNKYVAVLVYVPGMDLEDLAYGVTKFDDSKLIEFWVRKATLFGTDFL